MGHSIFRRVDSQVMTNLTISYSLLLSISLASLLIHGCNSKEPNKILLVFPDGYRGELLLTHDDSVPLPARNSNGVVTYKLAGSPARNVFNFGPLFAWHTLEAEFANGDSIRTLHSNSSTNFENLIACVLWSNSDDQIAVFVGSPEEAEIKMAE